MGQRCPSLPSTGSPATFRTDCPLEILFIHRRRRCARTYAAIGATSESDLTSLHGRHGGTCIHHSDTILLGFLYQACAVARASSAAVWRKPRTAFSLETLPGHTSLARSRMSGRRLRLWPTWWRMLFAVRKPWKVYSLSECIRPEGRRG